MKTDEIIERMSRMTHSPQGKYAADEETYKELLARLPENDRPKAERVVCETVATKHATVEPLWRRISAAASVAIILCAGIAIACIVAFGGNILPQSNADEAVTETASQNGVQTLVFDNVPLADITKTLSEAYGAEIEIEGSGLADYCLTATFTTDEPLDEVLTILAEAGGFDVKTGHSDAKKANGKEANKEGAGYILTPSR